MAGFFSTLNTSILLFSIPFHPILYKKYTQARKIIGTGPVYQIIPAVNAPPGSFYTQAGRTCVQSIQMFSCKWPAAFHINTIYLLFQVIIKYF